MKYIAILSMLIALSGCGWFNRNTNDGTNSNNGTPNNGSTSPNNGTTTPDNGTNTPDNGTDGTVTSKMSDLFGYFDEQGLTYANAKDIDVVDMNAHEGKMFEYENNPVYVYRMNLSDSNIQTWMNEVKNTGKVTINQNGKEESFEAIVNGEYILVFENGTDLNELKDMFKKYEVK